jgi:hypothetical protein
VLEARSLAPKLVINETGCATGPLLPVPVTNAVGTPQTDASLALEMIANSTYLDEEHVD